MASFVRVVLIAVIGLPWLFATAAAAPTLPQQQLYEDGSWLELTLPPGRTNHTAVYDPVRHRMIVFGGDGTSSHLQDVWALSLSGTPSWTQLHPIWGGPNGTAPSARLQHSAIYDPVRDRMLVFGGSDGTFRNDVWALSLSGTPTWILLTPSGTPPAPRVDHTAIYDPVRDRMIVFGGASSSTLLNDVWALSLSGTPAWTSITPSGTPPSARYTHTAIYDPVRDRMVIFGGSNGLFLNDVWALSLAGTPAWTSVTTTGTAPYRASHTCVYDPVRDRMVMFGGVDYGSTLNDVWALSLATNAWTMTSPVAGPPAARGGHTAIYDSVNDRMVISGGLNFGVIGDTWSLALAGSGTWARLTGSQDSNPPGGRWAYSTIFDASRDRMILFGGKNIYGGLGYLGDVWALPLSGDPVWVSLGSAPFQRAYHDAIYDANTDRMIVVGGEPDVSVWALALASNAWSNITPASGGPTASDPRSVHDPLRQRILVFGGFTVSGASNDLWALSLTGTPTWTHLTPSGTPPPGRWGCSMVYVPQRDAVVVFGGRANLIDFNDVWMLSLNGGGTPAWTQLTPTGPPPPERFEHAAVYDAQRQRMVIFGGAGPTGVDTSRNDVWALWMGASPAWQPLAPSGASPEARSRISVIYKSSLGRMIMFGGAHEDNNGNFYAVGTDVWALDFGAGPVSVDVDRASRIALLAPRPNPFRGSVAIGFTLPERMHVSIDVLDVQGRRVTRLADEDVDAGIQTRQWNGVTASGAPAAGGLYFVRMTTPRGAFRSKVVLTR